MAKSEKFRALILSLLILVVFLGAWQIATMPRQGAQVVDDEYAKLVGASAATGQKSTFPTPVDVGAKLVEHLSDPFYDRGANDKGIGIQLAWSVSRVALGFGLAALVAVPLGFLIGMSRLIFQALDPFIQVLKPISPLAWMPLALFTLKDSSVSAVFVIFICSIWPMLINTAFGVASVRKEWIDVSRTLEVSPLRKAFFVILPAAA
ncbi:MAG: nitrate transporter, permease protein, partial [Pseudomonadota bacterium]